VAREKLVVTVEDIVLDAGTANLPPNVTAWKLRVTGA
jgi:hypothetical protein